MISFVSHRWYVSVSLGHLSDCFSVPGTDLLFDSQEVRVVPVVLHLRGAGVLEIRVQCVIRKCAGGFSGSEHVRGRTEKRIRHLCLQS